MNLLETLMNDYIAISKQLAYYVSRKLPGQIDKYERDQRRAALKLIVAVATFHGITTDEFESEMRDNV